MKIFFFTCCLLVLCFSSFAQYIATLHNEDGYLKNADGSLIQKVTMLIEEGSTSIPEKNCEIVLKARNGKVYKKVNGRIDLKTGGLIFAANEQELMFALPIEKIIFDSCDAAVAGAVFKTGYPSTDKNNDKSLYQVLSEGKATLLKHHTLNWQDIIPFNTTNTTRIYTQVQQYYLYFTGKMFKLEKNKDKLVQLLPASNDYIIKNKLNLKKEEDAIKLVDYYNSLSF
jgi:hypothetical protein